LPSSFENWTPHLHFRIIKSGLKKKSVMEIQAEHEIPLLANKATSINNSWQIHNIGASAGTIRIQEEI